jgi:hypothetical protein
MPSIFEIIVKNVEASAKQIKPLNSILEGTRDMIASITDHVSEWKKGGGLFGMAAQADIKSLTAEQRLIGGLNTDLEQTKLILASLQKRLTSTKSSEEFEKLSKSTIEAKDRVEELERAIEDYNITSGKVEDDPFGGGFGRGGRGGQVAQSLSGITGTAQMFTGMSDSAFSKTIQNVNNLFSASSQLGMEFETLAGAATGVGGKFGGVLASGLTKVAGMIPTIGIAVAGISAGISAFDSITGKSAQSTRRWIDELQKQYDLELELAGIRRTGTVESLEELIASEEDRINTLTDQREEALKDAQEHVGLWDYVRTRAGGAIAEMGVGTVKAYGAAADSVRSLNTQLDDARAKISGYREAIGEVGERQAQEAAEEAATQRLNDAKQELVSLLEQEESAIKDFNRSMEDFVEENAYADTRQRQQREREDLKAAAEHDAEMQNLQDESDERLIELKKSHYHELEDLEAQFAKQNLEAEEQYN